MDKRCLTCNTVFSKKPSDSKKYWVVKKYCSIECSGTTFKKGHKLNHKNIERLKAQRGSLNPAWRGGKHKTTQGYVTILVGRHLYQLEHRHVMEKYLGRKLLSTEHVHHLNGDKTDNRIENLRLISQEEHGLAHAYQRWHNTPVDNL